MARGLLLLMSLLAGCDAHGPVCPAGTTPVHCVEECSGAPFIGCNECPDGSMSVEACGDGGLSD